MAGSVCAWRTAGMCCAGCTTVQLQHSAEHAELNSLVCTCGVSSAPPGASCAHAVSLQAVLPLWACLINVQAVYFIMTQPHGKRLDGKSRVTFLFICARTPCVRHMHHVVAASRCQQPELTSMLGAYSQPGQVPKHPVSGCTTGNLISVCAMCTGVFFCRCLQSPMCNCLCLRVRKCAQLVGWLHEQADAIKAVGAVHALWLDWPSRNH